MKVICIPYHMHVLFLSTVKKVDIKMKIFHFYSKTYFHLLWAFCAEWGMSRKVGSLKALGALCLLTRLDRRSLFSFFFTPGVVRDAVRASNVLSHHLYHHDNQSHPHDRHHIHIHLCDHIQFTWQKQWTRETEEGQGRYSLLPLKHFDKPWNHNDLVPEHSDTVLDWMRRTGMDATVQIIFTLLGN